MEVEATAAGETIGRVDRLAGTLVDTRNSSRQVTLELHMDDIHCGCCDTELTKTTDHRSTVTN